MAISTGGIIEGWGAPADALRSVMREVAQFRRPGSEDDYVIDIAFRLWDPRREQQFTGVRPGMVGRKQRRFVIWHGCGFAGVTGSAPYLGPHAARPSQGSPAPGLFQADRRNIDPVPGGWMCHRSGPRSGITAATARHAGQPGRKRPPGRRDCQPERRTARRSALTP